MRDPGTPRRNPLFEERSRSAETPTDDETPPVEVPPVEVPTVAEEPEAHERDDAERETAAEPHHDHSGSGGEGACPLCSLGLFASTMRDASPEVMEHLLGAAHEFLLAAKVVLDAADRAIELQRAQLTAVARERQAAASKRGSEPPSQPRPRPAPTAPSTPEGSGRVRRIHLA